MSLIVSLQEVDFVRNAGGQLAKGGHLFLRDELGLGGFEVFQRLGLSLAFDIVTQMHSGQLVVDTEVGRGTTFVARIPLG